MENPKDRLLSINEVCDLLGICNKTWHNLKKKYEIPYIKLGNRIVRVKESDLNDFIEQNRNRCL
jgi:excisionase family DNA binding protein